MAQNWNVQQIAANLPRDGPVERTKAAIRSRRKFLKDAYGNRSSLYQSFPLALQDVNHDADSAAVAQTPRAPKQWTYDDKNLIRKAVAEGLEIAEAREQYFPDRETDAVAKQMHKVFAEVVEEERHKETWPTPSFVSEPWSDMENLKLRRFHNQGVPFENIVRSWSPKRSVELLKKKWKVYHRQSKAWRSVAGNSIVIEEVANDATPRVPPAIGDSSQPNPSQPCSSPIRRKAATRQLKAGHVGSQTLLNWPRDKGKSRALGAPLTSTNHSSPRSTNSTSEEPRTRLDTPSAQLTQELAVVASSPKKTPLPPSTGRLRHPSSVRTASAKLLDLQKNRQPNNKITNGVLSSSIPGPSQVEDIQDANEEMGRVIPAAKTRQHPSKRTTVGTHKQAATDSARVTDTVPGVQDKAQHTSSKTPQSQRTAPKDGHIYIYDDNGHISGSRHSPRQGASPIVRVPATTPTNAVLAKDLIPFPSAQVPRERKPPASSAARAAALRVSSTTRSAKS
ncbi:hypothetical protein MRB53_039127 [Persea americana]|nr:hypothetical protein MRB53_039127 [Persea americana]